MKEPIQLFGHQTRPLIFTIALGKTEETRLSVEVRYRTKLQDAETLSFEIELQERSLSELQRMTYLHPSHIVSYAIIRAPPPSCDDLNRTLPVVVALHGAGLEADNVQAREMLDAAYGICAWMVFPSGVTSWSGDDWRTLYPNCR